jgi:Zn-dependent protease
MGWSWTIGKIAGIDLKIHATFALILLWVAVGHWRLNGWAGLVGGLFFLFALFGCIVLHELGHALAARHYGIGTKDITLLPIGGVARLERMPEDPRQEMAVALAGPAVNLVLAFLLFAWIGATGGWEPMSNLDVGRGSILERLAIVNLFLAGFNLLPAFPMDGGRVLRAFLASRLGYLKATQPPPPSARAWPSSLVFSACFTIHFLFSSPFLSGLARCRSLEARRYGRLSGECPCTRRCKLTTVPSDPTNRSMRPSI